MQLETVKVKNPAEEGGFMIINESDFDASVHEMFDAAPKEAGMTAKDLRAALDEKKIEYKASASKADLQALFDAAPKE